MALEGTKQMANFTTESAVRMKFQLTNTTQVPSDLVTVGMDDAHTELLRFLHPDVDTVSPEDGLILGETLLAGAHVLRSLASSDAVEQKHLVVGGQRIEEGNRFQSLMTMAEQAARLAWETLEPYLLAGPPRSVGAVTITTPVLGED
jgi:hypothetical protein